MKIGIDLGGTKIEGLVLAADGAVAGRRRIDTPRGDYAGTLDALGELVADLAAECAVNPDTPVGIGMPGALSTRTGLVKNANSTCLIGKPLAKDLETRLGRSVRLANDADCFTISEATDGAGAGWRVVFGVILGTGVGGGLCIDGKLWVGPNAITGEWGHNPLPWPRSAAESPDGCDERPGPACYCGKRGCVETYLSGPGFAADLGQSMSVPEIVAAARAGDVQCSAALARYEHRLARALAGVINILDPDAIVLGGGLSNIERFYDNVPKLWQAWVFSDHCDTKLLKNAHGDASGVRGAAWLWP